MPNDVLIDARIMHTGHQTYLVNILSRLPAYANGFAVRVIARRRDAEMLAPLCREVTVVDAPIYSLREQLEMPRAARGADLLHVPNYNVPVLYSGKLLVTIHDLAHISDPTYRKTLAAKLYARPMLQMASYKAAHIVTVSEYSKTQIVDRLGVDEHRISVIYNGVGAEFRCEDRAEARATVVKESGLQRPYLLYVGNLKPHKNVLSLLRCFALLRTRQRLDHQLVIVGDDPNGGNTVAEECTRLSLGENVRIIPQVSAEFLPRLYAAADLLVMPSFLEGFGLPVVEAMACGTPVACSRAASLPEVAGPAAEFFDPSSIEDMAAAIERVLDSQTLWDSLRRKGLERAASFSWDEAARRHALIYRDLLNSKVGFTG